MKKQNFWALGAAGFAVSATAIIFLNPQGEAEGGRIDARGEGRQVEQTSVAGAAQPALGDSTHHDGPHYGHVEDQGYEHGRGHGHGGHDGASEAEAIEAVAIAQADLDAEPGAMLFNSLRSSAAEAMAAGDLEEAAEIYESALAVSIPLSEAVRQQTLTQRRNFVLWSLADVYSAIGGSDAGARAYELRQQIEIDTSNPMFGRIQQWRLYADAEYLGSLGDFTGYDALIANFPEDSVRYGILKSDAIWVFEINRAAEKYNVPASTVKNRHSRRAVNLSSADYVRLLNADDDRLDSLRELLDESAERPDVHTLRIAMKLTNLLSSFAPAAPSQEGAMSLMIDARRVAVRGLSLVPEGSVDEEERAQAHRLRGMLEAFVAMHGPDGSFILPD